MADTRCKKGDHDKDIRVTRRFDHVTGDKAEYAATEAAAGAEDAANRRDSGNEQSPKLFVS